MMTNAQPTACGTADISESRVSVVIPTHNRSALLARAIRSVQAQTCPIFEIIVVDDTSSDNTSDVVAAIRDPRIRYFRRDRNGGGSAARNVGIRVATGEFIALLDDDDEWEPTKTEEQLRALGSGEAIVCASNAPDESTLQRLGSKVSFSVEDLRYGMPPYGGGASALMVRANVLKAVSFDEDLPRCQDWDLLIRLAARCPIRFLNRRLVRYNNGEHSRITTAILRNAQTVAEAERLLSFYFKHRTFFGEKWFRRHMSGVLLYGIRHRRNKLHFILWTVKKCGISAVTRSLALRAFRFMRVDSP